jgi:hypothetical protein
MMLFPSAQGTLAEWLPIGATLSTNGIILRIGIGRPVLHSVLSMLATWLANSCLAAALEIRQRTDFLNQRLASALTARREHRPVTGGKAVAQEAPLTASST